MFLSMVQWVLTLLLLAGGYVAWLFSPDISETLDAYQRKAEIDRAIMLQQTPRALELAQQAVVRHPKQPYFWQKLGYLSWQKNDIHEALQAYEQAFQLEPDNTRVTLNYSRLLLKQEQLNDAIRVLAKTAQLNERDPNTGYIWHQLTSLYWQCYLAAKHHGYVALQRRLLPLTEQCLTHAYQTSHHLASLKYIESQVWYEKKAYQTSLKSLCRLHHLPSAEPYRSYVYETIGTLLIEHLHEPAYGFGLMNALLRGSDTLDGNEDVGDAHATVGHASTSLKEAMPSGASQRLRLKYSNLRRSYSQQYSTCPVSNDPPESIIENVCQSMRKQV